MNKIERFAVIPPTMPARMTQARKKISTTVYITPEQDERLKALHGLAVKSREISSFRKEMNRG